MKKFVKKFGYIIFLFFVVAISYGQILGMYVWQDDNALFFKLAHIEGRAGYLGTGPFGEGPYKYTVTPYIPIYKVFGYSTFPYFFFNLVLIFLTSLCVYKVFSKIIGKSGGRIAGFLYVAGYIASDGFIRLFNGPITNLSIVLISLILLSLWNFYKEHTLKWYLSSVLFFFLATEFARARTHYLIGVVILFELIFLAFKKPIKSIFFSFLRILPFAFIFYEYFIRNADERTGQVKNFLVLLLKGDFQQLYSFMSSLGNLIFPDWLVNKVLLIKVHYLWILVPILISLTVFTVLKNRKRSILLTSFFILVLVFWTFFSRRIFVTSLLNLDPGEIFVAFLGGVAIVFFSSLYFFIKNKESKKLYMFLSSWVILNLLAYAAYNPTVSYTTINRYLAHSFFALVGLLAIVAGSVEKGFCKKLVFGIIVFWGLGNLVRSVYYQRDIILTRSNPPRQFYTELKSYLPRVSKNDVLYFDVASDKEVAFADAFSVAQMPETTAIAWRYGVDRYDFFRVTEFEDLLKTIKDNNLSLENIHSFFYGDSGLVDTTEKLRQLLRSGGKKLLFDNVISNNQKGEMIVDLGDSFESLVPAEITLSLVADPTNPGSISFPYSQNKLSGANTFNDNSNLIKMIFDYKKYKDDYYKRATVQTSSDWQKRVAANLIDNDPNTAWQADRVLWSKEGEASLTIDLKGIEKVSRISWINAFGNNTPVKYSISVSLDNSSWKKVKDVSLTQRVDSQEPQVVEFNPSDARFVKMTIYQSLNSDSPGISELLVLPDRFSSLNISEAEKFLKAPFLYVLTYESYLETLSGMGYTGEVGVSWQGDKKSDWVSQTNSKINVVYNGRQRDYKLIIPAGGTKITKIKLANMQIPGSIKLSRIQVRYLTINELEK